VSFTDGKPWVATENDCKASWMGAKNGKLFCCFLCCYKFVPGDVVRWQYTNDVPGAGGNPLVCQSCDGTKDQIVEKMKQIYAEFDMMKKRGLVRTTE
jgi:hypothetical protein